MVAMLTKNRILLAGATGYLGRFITQELNIGCPDMLSQNEIAELALKRMVQLNYS
jgi:thioester reductase-like protein